MDVETLIDFRSPEAAAKFATYPESPRAMLLKLRGLIFETAMATPGVGAIEETLKWGQPAYLTSETGSGSTIRLDAVKAGGGALYFHCQGGLIESFREIYGGALRFQGQRAILLDDAAPLPEAMLRHCIALALTHHLRKKSSGSRAAAREIKRGLRPGPSRRRRWWRRGLRSWA